MNTESIQTFTAIPIQHPLGEFYLTALPASLLVDCTFSDPLKSKDGIMAGLERRLDEKRADDIGEYIKTSESVFPGTIILAANWLPDSNQLAEDDEGRWHVETGKETIETVSIVVPTHKRVVTIVDGQHRVNGFKRVKDDHRLSGMMLPCAVFFGLPPQQQATIFATINANQKPVNKSITYSLFGYCLDESNMMSWTPEKLAVFLTRKLNGDRDSPFYGHIKVAAEDGRLIKGETLSLDGDWAISMATVVDGVLALFSKKPKEDRNLMLQSFFVRRSTLRLDSTPLREAYINGDDGLIYGCVRNYFTCVKKWLWSCERNDVLHKTAGVQALFAVLRVLLPDVLSRKDAREDRWQEVMSPLLNGPFDFGNQLFKESSAKGKGYIQDAILVLLNKKSINEVRDLSCRNLLSDR